MCLIKNNIESNNDISVGGNIINEPKPSTEEKKLPTKIPGSQAPRWREGEVSIKQFHTLSTEGKEEHIKYIQTLPAAILGDSDVYLIRWYVKKEKINFFSMEEHTKYLTKNI